MASTMVDAAYAAAGGPPTTSDKSGGRLKPGEDPGGGAGVAASVAGPSGVDSLSQPTPEALRKTLEDVISRESYVEVQRMKRDIEKMSKFERLLLYLELPSSLSGMTDPLRQPLNPLGSRHEIQLTITWIRTHLEEDPQISLPKHEVYDDYTEFCSHNGLKPLSTADFGKVMKQVFPTVRPRRLGTRGNSRYCYAGLKKRVKLMEPSTPEFCTDKSLKEIKTDAEEELNSSVSDLVREWAEKMMPGTKFGSLEDLAAHLIDKMYVDTRTNSAYAVMTAMQKKQIKQEGLPNGMESQDYKRKIEVPPPPDPPMKRGNLKRSKYSPTLANMVQRGPGTSKDSHGDIATTSGNYDVFHQAQPSQHHRFQPPQNKPFEPPPPPPIKQQQEVSMVADTPMTDLSRDNTLDDELGNYFNATAAAAAAAAAAATGTAVTAKTAPDQDPNQVLKINQLRQLLQQNLNSPTIGMASAGSVFKPAPIKPEPSSGSASTAGDWYGSGPAVQTAGPSATANNGQNQPADVAMSEPNAPSVIGVATHNSVAAVTNNSSSLSSRRRVSFNPSNLIQIQDDHNDLIPAPNVTITSSGGVIQQTVQQTQQQQQIVTTAAPAVAAAATAAATTSSVNGLGQSPAPVTARKRHFSFQPISPRQASLPQSPSASPFISPRSTPVPPMMRSRHSSGSALPLHLLPAGANGGQKLPNFNSSSNSDISRAATFGSASECSTPFISPHGTPIPFNRSRHNSAQGRLCRSRHSSGALGVVPPGYRYANTINIAAPYSPMALNNLNNPYSPQPATPVSTTCPDDMFVTTYVSPGVNHDGAGGCGGGVSGGMGTTVFVGGNPAIGGGGGGGNGNQVLILNEVVDRSRHSSAGSDHMMTRSAPMSPHCVTVGVKDVMIDNVNAVYTNGGGGDLKQRHRHASAGSMNYVNQNPTQQPVTLVQQEQDLLRSQPVPLRGNFNTLADNSSNPNFASAATGDLELPLGPSPGLGAGNGAGGGGAPGAAGPGDGSVVRKDGETQDDLELTLNALKDCDNDFSKFFETESGK